MIVRVINDFTRFAGDCRAWVGELPRWARLTPVGVVDTYWTWPETSHPTPAPAGKAAWGIRVGMGAMVLQGVLGATFEPSNHPTLRVAVAATTEPGPPCPAPFDAARVGLPHDFVGGVLAGAIHEADRVGPGTVTFNWAATHDVDTSWNVMRILAIGVMRLLPLTMGEDIPSDLLPYFGAPTPSPPGPT